MPASLPPYLPPPPQPCRSPARLPAAAAWSRTAALGGLLVLSAAGGCRAERVPVVRDAEVRPAIAGSASAAYFVLENEGRDTLVVDSVTTGVARVSEVHETTIDEAGVARMRPVGPLVVPPDSTVTLRPGSIHVMLMELTEPLVAGGRVKLTLWLRGGSTMETSALVRAP